MGTVHMQWRMGMLSPALTPTADNRDQLDFSVPIRYITVHTPLRR